MEVRYKAPKGQTTIIVTSFILLLYFFIMIKIIYEILKINRIPFRLLIGAILLTLILIISYLLSPKSYVLYDNELVIKQQIRSKRISYKEIKDIKLIQNEDLKGLIRTFGIGSLFGEVGKFYHKKYGRLNLFASQHKNIVLIETANKKYIISPNNIDIIDRIKEKIPASL